MPPTLEKFPLPPRAWLYARVSKDQRDGRSVSQQIDIGRRECDREGVEIVGEYTDNDRSASQYATKEREDWERLIVDLERNARPGDRLWGWEIARLTRDREVWGKLIRVCQQQHMFLWLNGRLYDTNDPGDMFFLDLQMATAVKEVGDTRKRILRDQRALAEAGRPGTGPGYGYRHVYDPDTGELAAKIPDPVEAPIVRRIAHLYLGTGERAGMSALAIAILLNQEGVPSPAGYRRGEVKPDGSINHGWVGATVVRLLRRPEIMGKRAWRGEIMPRGGWEPIVSEEDWWRIQAKLDLAGETHGGDARSRWLLSGIARCDVCGGPMYVALHRRKGRAGMRVYRCSGIGNLPPAGHVTRNVDAVEGYVLEALFRHFSRPDALAPFLGDEGGDGQSAARQARVAALEAERQQLLDRVARGDINLELAEAYEARLRTELEGLRDVRPQPANLHAVALAADTPEAVEATWRTWGLERQRAALRSVLEELRVLKTGKIGRRKLSAEETIKIRFKGQ
ncbi:recombinase family protein [Marinactinospora endophytica]